MGELYDLVINSKIGDKNSTLTIVNRFSPLLNKYSRKLNYDGADTDLTICLLETLKNMPIYSSSQLKNDNYIIAYLHTSIKHKYIHLSKKNCLVAYNETELNTDILGENSFIHIDEELFVDEIMDKLSDFQRQIIKSIYINNISESNLAIDM